MHPVVRIPYSFAGQLARAAAVLAPSTSGKLLSSLHARRGIRERYAAWGRRARDPSRRLLWVHAPSVGEGLQARPVIARLRQRHPDWQLAYTFYSPSAEAFAGGIGADFTDYLPFDTAGDADAALDALRPSALCFSKLDVWPLLVERAVARDIPVGIVSATFSAESARSSGAASLLLADAYRALASVGAVDRIDADRLTALGVRPACVTVTGDTRYDQVWERSRVVDRSGALLAPFDRARLTLVAGSTWPADELPLGEAWRSVRARIAGVRLIIAPHEPTAPHLRAIEQWADRERLTLTRLGGDADVVLVERTGVLGDLYAVADVAYVGGGFHAAGLHSVIEPAAYGAPVVFGPRFSGSRDAVRLIEAGGGFGAATGSDLAMRLLALFSEPEVRTKAGARACAVVESGLGAADRSADLIEALVTAA